MGTEVTFKRPDGADAVGYLASAAGAGSPSIVVIQEWWGLQGQIKGVCDRLAAHGFNALAPDLYKGVVVPYHDAQAANKEMASLNFLDATEQTVKGAAQFLARNRSRVGLTGFCMGGAVTIIGACRLSELAAGVAFYGLPPKEVAEPSAVRIPLQGHFANKDDWCTPALVDDFENGLRQANKNYEFYRYDAEHAFVNEERAEVHDRQQAELAWARALKFFERHLR